MKLSRLLHSQWIISLLSWLVALYIKFVYHTTRWQLHNIEELVERTNEGKPNIVAFWHSRLGLIACFAPKPEDLHVMISRHRDGEFIAKAVGPLRVKLIRGSTNRSDSKKKRGGQTALKEALELLDKGKTVAITPDGPRGPRMRVGGKIANIAGKTKVPVFAVAYSTTFGKTLSSWDRFLFPFPFGKGHLVCSKPIVIKDVSSSKAQEKSRKEIENQLNNVTRTADELAGRTPIEPAEV